MKKSLLPLAVIASLTATACESAESRQEATDAISVVDGQSDSDSADLDATDLQSDQSDSPFFYTELVQVRPPNFCNETRFEILEILGLCDATERENYSTGCAGALKVADNFLAVLKAKDTLQTERDDISFSCSNDFCTFKQTDVIDARVSISSGYNPDKESEFEQIIGSFSFMGDNPIFSFSDETLPHNEEFPSAWTHYLVLNEFQNGDISSFHNAVVTDLPLGSHPSCPEDIKKQLRIRFDGLKAIIKINQTD